MKLFAIAAILTALYFMYRMAFPKLSDTKQGDGRPPSDETDSEVVGKSRPVPDYRSQPATTPATREKSEKPDEEPDTFVPEAEKTDTDKPAAEIPPEELDDVFAKRPQPMDIDYPLETETETETKSDAEPDIDPEEEAEELRQTFGNDAELAGGLTYEEMEQAADTVMYPAKEKEAKAGKTLSEMEKTDMFEQLVSGDATREAMIKSVIERHLQSLSPETANDDANDDNKDSDYCNFNVADFLG